MGTSGMDGCGCVGAATCGDSDGAGGGAVVDQACGTGFVYDSGAADTICDGDGTNGNVCSMAFDHDKCCNPVTCANKDGNAGGPVTDGDCGHGYLRDSSAGGTLCTGNGGCDMAAQSADHAACCMRQATCGDPTGSDFPAITDDDCSSARSGFMAAPSSSAALCTASSGTFCDISSSSTVDFATCCSEAPLRRPPPPPPPPPPPGPRPPPVPTFIWPPPPGVLPRPTKMPFTNLVLQTEPTRTNPAPPPAPPPPPVPRVQLPSSLPHHGYTPPKLGDNVDSPFTFDTNALADASSRFSFATTVDFSGLAISLSENEKMRAIQLVSSTCKEKSPVWVLTPTHALPGPSSASPLDSGGAVSRGAGAAEPKRPPPLAWGTSLDNGDRRRDIGFGSDFWSTPDLLLTPDGRMFVLYVERRAADPRSQVVEMVLFELFTAVVSSTRLGTFAARTKVWDAQRIGFAAPPPTAHADDGFKLAYANHGVGNEHILMSNCKRNVESVAINLRTYTRTSRNIPMLQESAAGRDDFCDATKFTFIPEGVDHLGLTYDMLAVSTNMASVYVYLASSLGGIGIVSTQAYLAAGASFPLDEQFDIYSAPRILGGMGTPTRIYLSSATAVHALSWANMVSMQATAEATFALAVVREHGGMPAAPGTPVCFTFKCPRGTLPDPKSAIFDVPCTKSGGACTVEQCCIVAQKQFPGQSPIVSADVLAKLTAQLQHLPDTHILAATPPQRLLSQGDVASAYRADSASTAGNGNGKGTKGKGKVPKHGAFAASADLPGSNGVRNNVNTIGAIVFGVMLGVVGAIVRRRRRGNLKLADDESGAEEDPLLSMPIPSTQNDRRERTDLYPARCVPDELEDYDLPLPRAPWYAVYRIDGVFGSPNLEGGGRRGRKSSVAAPEEQSPMVRSQGQRMSMSPSQIEGGAMLSPRRRKRRNNRKQRSPQLLAI